MQNNERLELMKSCISTTNKIYKSLVDDVNSHLRKNIEYVENLGLTYEIVKNNAYSLDAEQIDYLETNIVSIKEVASANSILEELNETSKNSTHKISYMYVTFIDIIDEFKSKLKNIHSFSTDNEFYAYLEEVDENLQEIKKIISLHNEKLQNNFSEYQQFTIYTEHKEMIDIKFNISKLTAFALSTQTDDEFKNSIKLT